MVDGQEIALLLCMLEKVEKRCSQQ